MQAKSESEVTQSYLTLRDPMDCSPPGSSAHGVFQARVLEWVAITFYKSTKEIEKASDTDIRKGQKECPLLVFSQVIHSY